MKTAAAQHTDREQTPSMKGHVMKETPQQDADLGGLAEAIHEERRSAQMSVYSIKAVLDLLDMVNCSLPGELEEVDLGGIIHTLSGLIVSTLDSLTAIEERTREIESTLSNLA